MDGKPDWEAIRKVYEAGGISLRQLALNHDIPKTTVSERCKNEGWVRPSVRPSTDQADGSNEHIRILRNELPSPASALRGANLIIDAIVEILEERVKEKARLDIADYLKAANALSQCNRILVNAPPEAEEEEQKDFSDFSQDELRQYAEYEERARKRA